MPFPDRAFHHYKPCGVWIRLILSENPLKKKTGPNLQDQFPLGWLKKRDKIWIILIQIKGFEILDDPELGWLEQ